MTRPLSRPGVAFPVGATHPTPDVLLLTVHEPVPVAAVGAVVRAMHAMAGEGRTAVLRIVPGAVCQVWAVPVAAGRRANPDVLPCPDL